MIIRSSTRLRLSFGGGSDVSAFCDLHGSVLLNATIDLIRALVGVLVIRYGGDWCRR